MKFVNLKTFQMTCWDSDRNASLKQILEKSSKMSMWKYSKSSLEIFLIFETRLTRGSVASLMNSTRQILSKQCLLRSRSRLTKSNYRKDPERVLIKAWKEWSQNILKYLHTNPYQKAHETSQQLLDQKHLPDKTRLRDKLH